MNATHSNSSMINVGVVVIGRNEGERLKRCIRSLSKSVLVVYSDSGSTDGSADWARSHGADVIELDKSLPFTAARARNAGFKRLVEINPKLTYVQFVDGDCELVNGWLERAAEFFDTREDVAIVCGRLRERNPEHSIYNWLCDREWEGNPGEIDLCGGIMMMRVKAFEVAGGFREDLIAGEEPDLCVRLRQKGWHFWRLDAGMALHDAAMMRFRQWWRRAVRSGYVFAQGAYLHGAPPERHFVWQSRRAWLLGICLPLACAVIGFAFPPWGFGTFLIYPAHIVEKYIRNPWQLKQPRGLIAFFDVLAQFPYAVGQVKFLRDRWLRRPAALIEYK